MQSIITESILNINMLHRHFERGWNTGVKENTNHPDYDAAIATTRQLIYKRLLQLLLINLLLNLMGGFLLFKKPQLSLPRISHTF